MPTVGSKPSLRSTQAVGAVLLHQFARERFLQAGLDESLIREAEDREHLEDLATVLLHSGDYSSCDDTTQEGQGGDESTATINPNDTSQSQASPLSTSQNCTNNTESDEQYHSIIANQSTASNGSNDRTLYQSMKSNNTSRDSSTTLTAIHNTPTIATPATTTTATSRNGTGSSTESVFDRLQSSSPTLASYGQELRRIAEEFEQSRLRQSVKQRAEQVKLSEIKREHFTQLLEELFQDKITREKIVILFFFCTDVALRAAKLANELVIKLLGWSFSYIIDKVCCFVHKLGGWEKVLFYQIPSILISCCAVLTMFTLVIYLRKTLRG